MNLLNQKIENANSIVLLGHMNPDGDCLGSTLSIYNYVLAKYNNAKKVQVHLESSSEKFKVLPGYDKINDDQHDGIKYDLCIICDCSTYDRIKGFEDYFYQAKDKIIIDHHETNEMNDVDIILDGKAPATSQIVYDLLDKEYIDKNVATCLYVGLAHDTGVFRYSSTNKHTMEIAGDLISKGIDFTMLLDETIFMKKYELKVLTSKILERAKWFCDKKIIFSYTDDAELKSYNLTKKDIDSVIVELREIEGVKIAAFAYTLKENVYKISLRCNGNDINVANFAKENGGGGHKKASGFTLDMDIKSVEGFLEKGLSKLLMDNKNN